MSGVRISASTEEIQTGTSKKTVLQVLAASNHRAVIDEVSISFEGEDPTAAPVLVELIRQSDAGSGGDALTVQKDNPADDETVQTTAQSDVDGSTQPSDTAVLRRRFVHPQTQWTFLPRFKGEFHVPGGGRLGIAVTAQATVGCVAGMAGEE